MTREPGDALKTNAWARADGNGFEIQPETIPLDGSTTSENKSMNLVFWPARRCKSARFIDPDFS
jgi:hypothetical protein